MPESDEHIVVESTFAFRIDEVEAPDGFVAIGVWDPEMSAVHCFMVEENAIPYIIACRDKNPDIGMHLHDMREMMVTGPELN